jgi:hypothetical protein
MGGWEKAKGSDGNVNLKSRQKLSSRADIEP